ncbi:SDR family NAD(P)-dependent oxidoreductase [Curtobacterium sp. MCLR17_032]|uniref:SDR family NAD(P)-dependent oxidoreductase n=1 Tax=Curtobacterium sp. MCLR17_032 TaxID=2175650 RepID=UPI000DA90A10|nr:SDR family NAD(P)-dependent oxidoreductase [Curtobacterium sp. MCLR17_032]WIE61771.1 SDR family NAD(P)-dependent oxidoreductase [Curtobacterium sp. MCLR17_032]
MHLDLSDRVVVVTGGARGIGRTIAERFRREGAHVVALDLAAALDDRAADEQPGGPPTVPDGAHAVGAHALEVLACDVTDPASVRAAVDAVVARHGTVDVLVNNAGINVEGRVADLEWDAWRRCMDVNLGGTFLMSQAVAPVMQRAGRGRIINAASFAAIVPSVGSAAYAASKAAVVQFTRVLASELGPWGITVNAYAPGMVPTAMNGFATMPTADQDRLLDTLSIRRWETPDDVADVLLFLASDLAGYVTGTLLDVSGGKLATQIPSRAYEE